MYSHFIGVLNNGYLQLSSVHNSEMIAILSISGKIILISLILSILETFVLFENVMILHISTANTMAENFETMSCNKHLTMVTLKASRSNRQNWIVHLKLDVVKDAKI